MNLLTLKFPVLLLVATSAFAAPERPNIVFIFTDDMGYGDISPFSDKHKTPNLDRNAELKKNVRPAGLAQNPKPILPDATGIPTLAELRK